MMNMPQEALGAVPQPGVNPHARQAPAARPQPQPQGQPGQQGNAPTLSPQEINWLKNDPQIIEAVSMFLGKPVTLESIPERLLTEIAGMVEKLGVQGAVQMAQQNMPPEMQQQLRQAV